MFAVAPAPAPHAPRQLEHTLLCIDSQAPFAPVTNYYEQHFRRRATAGASVKTAAEETAATYLDGKPRLRGKHKITSSERDAGFWSSPFLDELPAEIWWADLMVLALARYFGQERIANVKLLALIAAGSPPVVCKAVR